MAYAVLGSSEGIGGDEVMVGWVVREHAGWPAVKETSANGVVI